jgi:hypothetical protein
VKKALDPVSWIQIRTTALIFLTFFLIVYLNTNLFQVKRNPEEVDCTVYALCADVRHKNCYGDVTNSDPGRWAPVMVPAQRIGLFLKGFSNHKK